MNKIKPKIIKFKGQRKRERGITDFDRGKGWPTQGQIAKRKPFLFRDREHAQEIERNPKLRV